MDQYETAAELIDSFHMLSRAFASRRNVEFAKGERFVLGYLYKKSGVVLPGEISAAMHVSTARIAALLNTLESRGLLVRMTDKHDRRRVDVLLTEAGRCYVESSQQQVLKSMAGLVEELGKEDAQEYLRITERMVAILAAQNKGK